MCPDWRVVDLGAGNGPVDLGQHVGRQVRAVRGRNLMQAARVDLRRARYLVRSQVIPGLPWGFTLDRGRDQQRAAEQYDRHPSAGNQRSGDGRGSSAGDHLTADRGDPAGAAPSYRRHAEGGPPEQLGDVGPEIDGTVIQGEGHGTGCRRRSQPSGEIGQRGSRDRHRGCCKQARRGEGANGRGSPWQQRPRAGQEADALDDRLPVLDLNSGVPVLVPPAVGRCVRHHELCRGCPTCCSQSIWPRHPARPIDAGRSAGHRRTRRAPSQRHATPQPTARDRVRAA